MTKDSQEKVDPITNNDLDRWATDPKGPVALHLKQKLLPVEAVENEDKEIVYPPTYADIGYNIDTLSDGTKVALIDSVGSQGNRMEPIFKEKFKSADGNSEDWLVPQIEIVLRTENCGECQGCKEKTECRNPRKESRSILDLAHRSADAVVNSSPELIDDVANAFEALRQTGDAGPLCQLAPTSLVFGVWDSRGGTGEKRPRLVRSVIRAWNVEPLHAAAQFNSVWKSLDEAQQNELEKEAKKHDKNPNKPLSEKGLKDAPAVFRKTKIKQYDRDGLPNPEARVLGGVVVKGGIERDITVNLIALRGLRGKDETETTHIRKYLLGLSLLAATADIDLFLREGCHLRYAGDDKWHAIPRRGEPTRVDLASDPARSVIEKYASSAAEHFKAKWPEKLEYTFDLNEAKKLLAKKIEEESSEE